MLFAVLPWCAIGNSLTALSSAALVSLPEARVATPADEWVPWIGVFELATDDVVSVVALRWAATRRATEG